VIYNGARQQADTSAPALLPCDNSVQLSAWNQSSRSVATVLVTRLGLCGLVDLPMCPLFAPRVDAFPTWITEGRLLWVPLSN
jgi:hypothetical protein